MGRFDKAHVYNAGQRDHTKPMIVQYSGKDGRKRGENTEGSVRRRQLWPAGTVERFVNLQGTVVQCVLVPPGVPASKESVAQAKAKLHSHKTTDGEIVGFIEHSKCPLKTGVADLDPTIAEEIERIRDAVGPACKEHPVTFKRTAKGIEYFDSCPHVQELIKQRRLAHRAKVEARMKRQKTVLEMESEKLLLAQQQAEATTRILERVADKLDAAPPRPRKQQAPESGE